MGSYLNPGTGAFQMARNSEIFIDKSRLIEETNRHVNTIQRFLCVSRPRRFGKSMAADMLAAYYDCKDRLRAALFDDLQIAQAESYHGIHVNKYECPETEYAGIFKCCRIYGGNAEDITKQTA